MKIFYAFALFSVIGFNACSKDPVERAAEPTVESMASLSRVFNYPDLNQKDSAGYTTTRDSVRTATSTTPSGVFSLTINMPFSKGRDYTQFTIDGEKLKPGYVGVYDLKPAQASGLQGDAQNLYGYRRDEYSYTELGMGNAEGTFVITNYDAQKKLIAGNYHFNIHSFHDPKVGMNWHETNIIVSGEFVKVVVP